MKITLPKTLFPLKGPTSAPDSYSNPNHNHNLNPNPNPHSVAFLFQQSFLDTCIDYFILIFISNIENSLDARVSVYGMGLWGKKKYTLNNQIFHFTKFKIMVRVKN